MVNQSYPSLDGVEPSWADIAVTFTVSGGVVVPMEAIDAIKTGRKVEVGTRYGASGGRPKARTTGKVSYDSTATLYRSGFRQLLKALMTQAPSRGSQKVISLVSFDILMQHTPQGETEIYQRKWKGCRYLGDSDDNKEGTDPDKIEITLNPIEVVDLINGFEVVLL